jgi:glutamate-1-semialdehyde 2,1-aminomutase
VRGGALMPEELCYLHETKESGTAYEQAREMIPGGVQGNIKYYGPYPLSFVSASGAWLRDVDGHEYVDYLMSFGSFMLTSTSPLNTTGILQLFHVRMHLCGLSDFY